jgi:hypothetical protein
MKYGLFDFWVVHTQFQLYHVPKRGFIVYKEAVSSRLSSMISLVFIRKEYNTIQYNQLVGATI